MSDRNDGDAGVLRLAIGVIIERRQASSPWVEALWRPTAVLAAPADAAPWTRLTADSNATSYYAGPTEIALYRSETEGYQRNLMSGAPSVWVVLHETGSDPPYIVGGVTVDPAEGEGWTEAGPAIVEAVSMPRPLYDEVAGFIARHPPGPGFVKRQRQRADPEALARRTPPTGRADGRR